MVGTVAARVAFGAQSMDPECVSSGWDKTINLHKAFVQN